MKVENHEQSGWTGFQFTYTLTPSLLPPGSLRRFQTCDMLGSVSFLPIFTALQSLASEEWHTLFEDKQETYFPRKLKGLFVFISPAHDKLFIVQHGSQSEFSAPNQRLLYLLEKKDNEYPVSTPGVPERGYAKEVFNTTDAFLMSKNLDLSSSVHRVFFKTLTSAHNYDILLTNFALQHNAQIPSPIFSSQNTGINLCREWSKKGQHPQSNRNDDRMLLIRLQHV